MNKTIFLTKCFSLLLLALFMTGCAVSNSRLGISQEEWSQYSYEKKEEIREAYRVAQYQKQLLAVKPGEGMLQVDVAGGTMLLPPYDAQTRYQPLSFSLKQGSCYKNIPVESADSSQSGKLKVCYTNDTLYFDPSPYDSALSVGSLQFPYMAVWKRGFTYSSVTGAGLLKLTNVDITVKQVISANN